MTEICGPKDGKVCVEVVSDLGENSGPVDGIDGGEFVGLVGFGVCKQCFDNVLHGFVSATCGNRGLMSWTHLAIIERPLNGEIVYILIQYRSHLSLLYWADLSFGIQNED